VLLIGQVIIPLFEPSRKMPINYCSRTLKKLQAGDL